MNTPKEMEHVKQSRRLKYIRGTEGEGGPSLDLLSDDALMWNLYKAFYDQQHEFDGIYMMENIVLVLPFMALIPGVSSELSGAMQCSGIMITVCDN